MRRILWIAGLVIAFSVLLVLLIPAAVDVNKFRPEIERQLAATSGRKVRVGPITLSVFPPVVLRVSDVRIEDPGPQEEPPLLEVPSMELRVNPWAYFQGKTVVQSIRLFKPRITLRQLSAALAESKRRPEGTSPAPTPSTSSIKVSDIYLSDFSLTVLDENAATGQPLFRLDDADLTISEFDPSRIENPFDIEAALDFSGSTLATRLIPEPMRFQSGVGKVGGNQFTLSDIKASIQGTALDGQISAAPLNKPAITFQLHFQEVDLQKLQGWIRSSRVPPPGGLSKAGGSSAAAPELKWKLSGTLTSDRTLLGNKVVENTVTRLRLENNNLFIDEFKGRFYAGTLATRGKMSLSADNPAFQLNSTMRGVNLAQLLADKRKPERLTGLLDLDAEINGTGLPRGAEDPLSNLRGTGKFSITDGSLKTLNLLEKLKILSIIPFLKVIEGPITSFSSLKSDFRLNGRRIDTDRMRLSTGPLSVVLSGYCTLDEEMDYIARVEDDTERPQGSLVGSILGMVARNINAEFTLRGTLSRPEISVYRR